ncbi:hypothetical protein EXD82_02940 [Peptacetobacter hominis]|uniref:DnaA N-terminal domain-containing protein n=1 Tax=Peptacetobacter hominis TaxID=2743610 RepID=A0A544QWK4_9FIRM|nr:hypothetical protein [Peptacetobacter hominis]TQQ85067.1 hypothetical protein EXD82_02940 [Peptacetobacter hominis]
MDIENIIKDAISSMSEDIQAISEGIDKIKFSKDTLYIIVKNEDIKNRVNDVYIYIIKKYLSAVINGAENINIVFISRDEIIDIGIKSLEKSDLTNLKEQTVEVRPPKPEIEEEKEELNADIQNIDVMDIWKVMLGRIQELISPAVYQSMFRESYQSGYDSGVVYVTVKDLRTAQIMETQYRRFLKEVSYELFGLRLSFRFIIDEKEKESKEDDKVYPVNIDDINSFLRYLKSIENR